MARVHFTSQSFDASLSASGASNLWYRLGGLRSAPSVRACVRGGGLVNPRCGFVRGSFAENGWRSNAPDLAGVARLSLPRNLASFPSPFLPPSPSHQGPVALLNHSPFSPLSSARRSVRGSAWRPSSPCSPLAACPRLNINIALDPLPWTTHPLLPPLPHPCQHLEHATRKSVALFGALEVVGRLCDGRPGGSPCSTSLLTQHDTAHRKLITPPPSFLPSFSPPHPSSTDCPSSTSQHSNQQAARRERTSSIARPQGFCIGHLERDRHSRQDQRSPRRRNQARRRCQASCLWRRQQQG